MILQKIYDSEMINKPLFIEDFADERTNYDSLKTMLSNYVKSGDLRRYAQGIYYVPKKTLLGESVPSFDSVVERKYISDRKEVFGYYAGMSLLNLVGLTTQVPNIPEITTNREATRKRRVVIGNRTVIVRRSLIRIDEDNAKYLQFMDIFRYSDQETISANKEKIIFFFENNGLSYETLMMIEKEMPMKIRKAFRRTGIYDELTYRQR